MQTNNVEPWTKNPMVWLVIAIPTATVLGCIATIALAISHPDIVLERTPIEVTDAER